MRRDDALMTGRWLVMVVVEGQEGATVEKRKEEGKTNTTGKGAAAAPQVAFVVFSCQWIEESDS